MSCKMMVFELNLIYHRVVDLLLTWGMLSFRLNLILDMSLTPIWCGAMVRCPVVNTSSLSSSLITCRPIRAQYLAQVNQSELSIHLGPHRLVHHDLLLVLRLGCVGLEVFPLEVLVILAQVLVLPQPVLVIVSPEEVLLPVLVIFLHVRK